MRLYIKDYLRLNGITQQMLADRLSISVSTVKTTLGKDNITLTSLEKIAEVIGVEPYKLLLPPEEHSSACTCPCCGKHLRIVADE